MPLTSDLKLDVSKFAPEAVSDETKNGNANLINIMAAGPQWYEVGAKRYREMRWNGETPLPKPAVIESGINTTIPSREAGRAIPCRVFYPENGATKGVFMHLHGGGWVLQSEAYQDTYLKFVADSSNLTVVSVGYRLAPEHPFPAGPEDCYDAAEHLVSRGKEQFGGDLMFAGGESAGGHLSVLVALHLLKTKPSFGFRGLILHYGAYDLANWLPAVINMPNAPVLNMAIMNHYMDSFLPKKTPAEFRDPSISPIYAKLEGLKLPPALFTVGTVDPLLDDTMMMAVKWMQARGEAIVKIYPGAPHGFTLFPYEQFIGTKESHEDTKTFISDKMSV